MENLHHRNVLESITRPCTIVHIADFIDVKLLYNYRSELVLEHELNMYEQIEHCLINLLFKQWPLSPNFLFLTSISTGVFPSYKTSWNNVKPQQFQILVCNYYVQCMKFFSPWDLYQLIIANANVVTWTLRLWAHITALAFCIIIGIIPRTERKPTWWLTTSNMFDDHCQLFSKGLWEELAGTTTYLKL